MANQSQASTVDVGIKLIAEYVTEAYDLRLQAHDNQLECRANITVHDTENSIAPAELVKLLKKNNISDTVDLEQVAIFCSEAALGENPQNVLIAKGIAAIEGEDGWFELIVATGDEQKDFDDEDIAHVDFKLVQTFSNVVAGQQIGAIHPPTDGVPGKNIFGEIIQPTAGKPSKLRAGPGVDISSDGQQAVATQQGRAVFESSVLSVVDEFVVSGDVDLSVGHITFNGFVVVKGDVLDDFNITATKGVDISGAVGACKIKSDGPVSIGTMAGMGTGSIHCKGNLKARYLNQVKVECLGNINVSGEVRNSSIKATGLIDISKGMITGGEAVALEGIEARIIGARAGVKTYLTTGIYFPEADRLAYLKTQLKSAKQQITRIDETLGSLKKKNFDGMRPALREAYELRIDVLSKRETKLDADHERHSEELQNFKAADHPTANPKINAKDVIKEGVVIVLGESREEFGRDISGPVTIVENTRQGGLRQLTYSPLKISAADTELKALEEEADCETEGAP